MKPRSQQILMLVVATAAIVVCWCCVLPWVSRRPSVQRRLQFLDERGIDPSAMYYTELDAMDAILDRLEGRVVGQEDTTQQ